MEKRFLFLMVWLILFVGTVGFLLWFLQKASTSVETSTDTFVHIPPTSLATHITVGPIDYPSNPQPETFFITKVYCDQLFPYLSNLQIYIQTTKGKLIKMMNYYDSLKPDDFSGQIYGQDNDQYSHYFFAFPMVQEQIKEVILFPLNNVNYWSFLIGDRKTLQLYKTFSGNSAACTYSVDQKRVPNPFVQGSPTTDCYPLQDMDNRPATYFRFANLWTVFQVWMSRKSDEQHILPDFYHKETGKIGVFRVDKQTSLESFISESVKVTCFDDYLFSSVQFLPIRSPYQKFPYENFMSYGIMRVALFPGYVPSCTCNTWTKEFQVGYFSVTFHVSDELFHPPLLPFWTVNLRMLQEIADEEGYAHIFWAPYEEVLQQMKDPHQTIPPIIQWGSRRGYLLQTPTGRIIFRYKQVNPQWIGYPGNAVCYDTFLENKAITNQLIDPNTGINYCPSLYGQRFPNWETFMKSPFIGVVPKNGAWPSLL